MKSPSAASALAPVQTGLIAAASAGPGPGPRFEAIGILDLGYGLSPRVCLPDGSQRRVNAAVWFQFFRPVVTRKITAVRDSRFFRGPKNRPQIRCAKLAVSALDRCRKIHTKVSINNTEMKPCDL